MNKNRSKIRVRIILKGRRITTTIIIIVITIIGCSVMNSVLMPCPKHFNA